MELFGSLPSDGPRETVVVLDAVEMIANGAQYHYEELKELARAHTQSKADNMAFLVAASVALLNTLQRLRLMIKKVPGDSDIKLARSAFESAVQKVEPVRHHVEHLDEKTADAVFAAQGAFGALSWWYEEGDEWLWTTVIPGHVVQGAQSLTRTPKHMREDVDHFWIVLGDSAFDLSDKYWAMQTLVERLREWASRQRDQGWPTLRKHQRPARP